MPSRSRLLRPHPSLCCLLLAALLLALSLSGCGRGAHADTTVKSEPSGPPVIKAAVMTVESLNWPAVVRTQGSIIADEVTIVGAKVAGRVQDVTCDLGDVEKAGTVLAWLDQEDFKLQVILAQAQLMQARAALGLKPTDPLESLDPESAPPVREAKAMWDETRTKIARVRQLQLHSRNTVTQEEYDQAVAAEGAAAARHAAAINAVQEKIALISVRSSELKVAQQRLEDTVLRAPFDGLVQERHVAHGSFVQLGDPIVTLVRTGVVRFHGTIPERHAHRLALGEEIKLKIEGVPQQRTAKVTRISPSVDEMSRSLAFEAVVPNQDGSLRTGLFAEGEVVVDAAAQSLVIPTSAIMEFAGAEKVWKLVDGVAKEQVVQTARHGERGIEIVGGLKAGDTILTRAMEGRVARIDPIYEAPLSPSETTTTEVAAGEEEDATATQGRSL